MESVGAVEMKDNICVVIFFCQLLYLSQHDILKYFFTKKKKIYIYIYIYI